MKDLYDLPAEVKNSIKFYPVEEVFEVLPLALPGTFGLNEKNKAGNRLQIKTK